MITTSFGASSNGYSQIKKAVIKNRYDEVYAHEQKHKQAAGKYGGPIVIETDGQGIPTGGHVNVQMPVLDKKDPNKTIEHANTIMESAMAPKDPSPQDYEVAAKARATKAEAKSQLAKNATAGTRLNCYA